MSVLLRVGLGSDKFEQVSSNEPPEREMDMSKVAGGCVLSGEWVCPEGSTYRVNWN